METRVFWDRNKDFCYYYKDACNDSDESVNNFLQYLPAISV